MILYRVVNSPVLKFVSNLYASIIKAATALSVVIVVVWGLQNTFSPTVTVSDIRVVGGPVVHAGGTVQIAYDVIRYRSCTVDISRNIRRVDDKSGLIEEIQIGMAVRVITSQPGTIPTSYSIDLPKNTVPGNYVLFSQNRYFCNGLDYLWPRNAVTGEVALTVLPELHPDKGDTGSIGATGPRGLTGATGPRGQD